MAETDLIVGECRRCALPLGRGVLMAITGARPEPIARQLERHPVAVLQNPGKDLRQPVLALVGQRGTRIPAHDPEEPAHFANLYDWRTHCDTERGAMLVADTEYLDASSTATCASSGQKVGDLQNGRDISSAADPDGFPHGRTVGAEPTRQLRVVSLNLRATPSRRVTALAPLVALLERQQPDVVLLQECRKGWTELVCQELGLEGVSTHQLLVETAGLPADRCAIAVRPPLRMMAARPLEQGLFMPAAIETLIGPDTPSGYEQLPESCWYASALAR